MGNLKIVRVPIPTPTLWPHYTTNCYLIGNENDSVLIDAGYDQEATKTELEKALLITGIAKPRAIILTHYHRDHAPGVKQLTHLNATIYCHDKELDKIKNIAPASKISLVSDGDRFPIDQKQVIILHAPGHTHGHLSIYVPSKKTLIAGDNIVAEGTSWIGPPDGDMTDYLLTLEKLRALDLEKIAPGHGDWVMNPYEQIDFVINRRLAREAQIQDLLQAHGSLTATNMTTLIYQDSIHSSLFEVARKTTEAHLIKLIRDGIVTKEEDTYKLNP